MVCINLSSLKPLPPKEEIELTEQHNQEILHLLPFLGPLFGFAVVLFHVWDHLIDPTQAKYALAVRLSLVALGAIAYFQTRLTWNALQRCGFVYWTHLSAIIMSEYLISDGFLYGLSGITACVFGVSILTYRIRTFLIILSVPSFLFVFLLTKSFDVLLIINGLMMYLFSFLFALIILLVIRSFRQKNFLVEKKLLKLTRHDPLTGVFNRAYITELAEHAFLQAKRHHRPLAIAMLDIDKFKRINDIYGHDIGDIIIQSLSATSLKQLRQIDLFGRFGGEEFICILPETSEKDAFLCMERLRQKIAETIVETPNNDIQFTVSIGVAILTEEHEHWLALLKSADIAMYKAKNSGRNCTILFSQT